MASFDLSPLETRVLGCLLEKERLTPENYPLSLNSLTLACNQSTSREPVMSVDEKAVEAALFSLREKKLATMIFGAGSRVQKYRHNLPDHYELNALEAALLCVLMLRGPQTPGELRTRTERMCGTHSLEQIESSLEELGRSDAPLVRVLPPRPGQKERRYVQLVSGEPTAAESAGEGVVEIIQQTPEAGKIEALEGEVAQLKSELAKLREEFAAFRAQFES